MPKRKLSRKTEFIKFLQSYLLPTSNSLHFSSKKESLIMFKMTIFWKKKFSHFSWRENKEIYFFITHLFLTVNEKEIIFQEYIDMN